MSSFVPFESHRVKEIQRQQKREARKTLLEQAKKEYEKEQRKQEQAKLRGDDKWMLPSVEKRINQEKTELEKIKSKKHKKEKKKKKKLKKEKKQKKKQVDSDTDSSSEDSISEQTWVEKGQIDVESKPAVKGPQLQRDSWMESPLEQLIPTTSRQDIREKIEKDKEEKRKEKNLLDKPGQHERELNPYWKGGGLGLPEEEKKQKLSTMSLPLSGDGGLSWMKKAYQRCVEQAQDEGRTLESVATEKYGSLKKLESMVADAEKANRKVQSDRNDLAAARQRENQQPKLFMKESYDKTTDRYKRRSRSWSRSNSLDRSRSGRSRSRDRQKHRRSRSKSRDRSRQSGSRDWKYSRRSSSRERYNRRRSHSREKRSPLRSKEKHLADKNSTAQVTSRRRFMRPGEFDDKECIEKTRSKFLKPDYSDDDHSGVSKRKIDSEKGGGYTPSWRKKEFRKPDEVSNKPSLKNREEERRKRHHSPSPSSTSSSSSSSELSESDDPQESKLSNPPQQEIKVLTEQEMNELGAKILKAELMGNQDLAKKLKEQLETSRKLREAHPSTAGSASEEGDDGKVVVLTRTGRDGMVRPLDESRHPKMQGKGRKRHKEKVDTHCKSGERQRYFDDDEKYDLKKLVEREKLGTAEDQNSMYARLAGRAVEKTDDEYQLDDVFMNRAAKKQSEAQLEERDRAKAIGEHRKMSSAMEKCQFCFENVPKHLIVAIGMKVYLCLPNHRSLTEGHCLIVPMQHVASSTAMDEDVWNEVQVFRKGLTKMFEDMDQDVVFMETCMGLKFFPHMHLECIPMPKETGDLAPIYFKKAIQESESEWSQNKKLIDLREKNVRRSIPKGFPFFSVDFGLQGGFAHVIEDEQIFPRYFGKEIVGGMVDAEPRIWRKPQKENFDNQRKKVLQFADWWKPYDWTNKLSDAD